MKVIETPLAGMVVIEPRVFSDARGFFMETFSADRYAAAGIVGPFVQDNVSFSRGGVLRGLHVQHPHGQAKLVSVLDGEIFDVGVDVRVGSPSFGRWYGHTLSSGNKRQLFLPAGFAHGFVVTSDSALVMYKCSDDYHPELERTVLWNDDEIGITWPVDGVQLSEKDNRGCALREIAPDLLPRYAP